MASIITASDATVKIIETLNLNNKDRGSSITQTVENVGELVREIKTVSTSGNTIMQFGTKGAGVMSASDVKYIRITNLDDTNYIDITCSDHITAGSSTALFAVRLTAGQTFMLGGTSFNSEDDGDADNLLATSGTIANISAKANTASVDIEMFIMSV